MRKLRRKWLVEYELWVSDSVLGPHQTIFNRWYYTKLGAHWDMFQQKQRALRGTKFSAKLYQTA